MDMKKCDVCGKTGTNKWFVTIEYTPPSNEEFCPCWKDDDGQFYPYWKGNVYDLCPKCMRNILEILRRREIHPSDAEREIEEKRKTKQEEQKEQIEDQPTERNE